MRLWNWWKKPIIEKPAFKKQYKIQENIDGKFVLWSTYQSVFSGLPQWSDGSDMYTRSRIYDTAEEAETAMYRVIFPETYLYDEFGDEL